MFQLIANTVSASSHMSDAEQPMGISSTQKCQDDTVSLCDLAKLAVAITYVPTVVKDISCQNEDPAVRKIMNLNLYGFKITEDWDQPENFEYNESKECEEELEMNYKNVGLSKLKNYVDKNIERLQCQYTEPGDKTVGLVVLLERISKMKNSQFAEFFQYCYCFTHDYDFPYVLREFIGKMCPVEDAVSSRSVSDITPSTSSSNDMKRLREKVTSTLAIRDATATMAFEALNGWIRLEKFARDHLDIKLRKNSSIKVVISACMPQDIGTLITFLQDKVGLDFPMYELRFIGIDFTFNIDPLLLAHLMIRKISKMVFEKSIFVRGTFILTEKEIQNLMDVISLSIINCGLASISDDLKLLSNLNILNISEHDFEKIPVEICDINSLKVLRIRNGPLNEISAEIKKLVNLKTLSVSCNKLGKIPDVIAEMDSLEKLVIINNNVLEIPVSITKMQNLSVLILNDNDLSNSSNLCQLSENIKHLSISGCNLEEIPKFSQKMTKLKYLICNRNKISRVDDELTSYVPNIRKLGLANNIIEVLPVVIDKFMKTLRYLTLSGNKLSNFPDFYKKDDKAEDPLNNLKVLILSENKRLTSIPSRIKGLRALRELDISGCGIKYEWSGKWHIPFEVERLDVSNNNLDRFPVEFTTIDNLVYLNLSNNRFTSREIPKEIENLEMLETLKISRCELSGALCPEICKLKSLKHLDISHNNNLNSLPDKIGELKQLRELDISFTSIWEFPKSIWDLSFLRVFNIKTTEIYSFPDDMSKLKNLEKLCMTIPELIPEFPKSICNITWLKALSVHSSFSEPLPAEFSNLRNLKELSVDGTNVNLFLDMLKNIPGLRSLELKTVEIKHEITLRLGRMDNLRKLTIRTQSYLKEIVKNDSDLPMLQELRVWVKIPEGLAVKTPNSKNLRVKEINGEKKPVPRDCRRNNKDIFKYVVQ